MVVLGVRTVVTFLFSLKTKTRGLSREGNFRVAASDPSSASIAHSIALCVQDKQLPFCDSFSVLEKQYGQHECLLLWCFLESWHSCCAFQMTKYSDMCQRLTIAVRGRRGRAFSILSIFPKKRCIFVEVKGLSWVRSTGLGVHWSRFISWFSACVVPPQMCSLSKN